MIIPVRLKMMAGGEDYEVPLVRGQNIVRPEPEVSLDVTFFDTETLQERTTSFHVLVRDDLDSWRNRGHITYRDGLSEDARLSLVELRDELVKLLGVGSCS